MNFYHSASFWISPARLHLATPRCWDPLVPTSPLDPQRVVVAATRSLRSCPKSPAETADCAPEMWKSIAITGIYWCIYCNYQSTGYSILWYIIASATTSWRIPWLPWLVYWKLWPAVGKPISQLVFIRWDRAMLNCSSCEIFQDMGKEEAVNGRIMW